MDGIETWSGIASVRFASGNSVVGPASAWMTMTPTPVSRFQVILESPRPMDPSGRLGLATMQLDHSPHLHRVLVSRSDENGLTGHFNGSPPVPLGQAKSVSFGVINLDPSTLWLEEMVFDTWRFRLEAQLAEPRPRERLRDVLGVAETHAGVLDRSDGRPFDAETAMSVLEGWRLGMSFATGSRIGLWRHLLTRPSSDDDIWRSMASPNVTTWHDRHRIIDAHDVSGISELIALILARRQADPAQAATDELAINYALEANGTTPIEMRIAAVGGGLELLAWDQLVENPGDGKLSRAQRKDAYVDRRASGNFAALFKDASIDMDLPASLRPFAVGTVGDYSGAVAIAALRNRVMHPRRRDGMLTVSSEVWADGWQLGVQHLELVILHRLGYTGRFSDRFRSGWVGVTFEVPWVA